MKNLKIIFFIFLFCSSAFAASVEERRTKVISIIDQELKEITRLNKQTGSRNPNLLLRMAELLLEKARHVKEQENAVYLGLDSLQRASVNKSKYFKKSQKYFVQAQKTCYYILKRFKKFKQKGDVYYILAYNAKEFQQQEKAQEFFKRAMKYSSRNSNSSQKSKIALAQIYYNKKDYRKAIPLFEQAFKSKKDRWYTKDAYNLAWCYFRTKQRSKAIKLMNEVYELSKNSRYVNMSSAVERDLAFFYTEAGQTKSAINFYKKSGKDISSNLIKVAKYLITQGKNPTSAERALSEAKNYVTDPKERIDANIALLGLYERFGNTSKHLKVCEELYGDFQQGNLDEDSLDQLKYHVQKMSALLQKQVASKRYEKQRRTKRNKAKKAIAYFNILAGLDTKNTHRASFHAAETNYASNKYDEAVVQYDRAFKLSKQKGDSKIAGLALEGMIASLGAKSIKKSTTDAYLTKVYLLYLQNKPKSKKSYKIYQRLFSAYIEKKEFGNAEKVLYAFKKNYPKDYSTQEAMIAKIMDHYKDKNDKDSIKLWVTRINRGEFKVSKKYARKLKLLLLTMQFEGVEKFNTKGDKTNALKGYVQIYRNKDSSSDAKKNAAYNIAVLFYELGNKKYSYLWSEKALNQMNGSDVKKFDGSFLAISSDLFNRQEFEGSAKINQLVLAKLCKQNSKNKKLFFRNSNVILLSEKKLNESQNLIKKGLQCSIEADEIKRARVDLMNAVIEEEKWGLLESLINTLSVDKSYRAELIQPLSILRSAFISTGRESEAERIKKRILSYYNTARKRRQSIPLEALDVVASFELISLEAKTKQLQRVRLEFPEKVYNDRLKKKFELLDRVTSKALKILEIGSGVGIVASYKYLVLSYQGLVDDISRFAPAGKSPEYVKSFQGTMRKIVLPLNQKAQDFRREARKQIIKSSILSKENNFFLNGEKLKFSLEFSPRREGVLMDRGGGQ
ncbi:MAG: tetratricopeptide (TPR) repeat protein [Bacteriovoracaceae bacterium]|jgi:tetratricopeptide (TPR) repeat protein